MKINFKFTYILILTLLFLNSRQTVTTIYDYSDISQFNVNFCDNSISACDDNPYINCNSVNLIGPADRIINEDIQISISSNTILNSHYQITVTVDLYLFNDWSDANKIINIYLDNKLIQSINSSDTSPYSSHNTCTSFSSQNHIQKTITSLHTADSWTLDIKSNNQLGFGVETIKIDIDECPDPTCLNCPMGTCCAANEYLSINKMVCTTTCINPYVYNDDSMKCQISCPSGYIEDDDRHCIKCLNNCFNCENTSTCLQCDDGYYLSTDLTYCHQDKCPTGQYATTVRNSQNTKVDICYTCPKGCTECTSVYACTICDDYYTYNNGQCLPCLDDYCIHCQNDQDTCIECETPYLVYNGNCVSKSQCQESGNAVLEEDGICYDCSQMKAEDYTDIELEKIYSSDPKSVCFECFDSCNTCIGDQYDQCISCLDGVLQVDPIFGTCGCGNDDWYIYNSNYECEEMTLIPFIIIYALLGAGIIGVVIYLKNDRMLLLILLDQLQLLSLYVYLNFPQTSFLKLMLKLMNYYNLNNLIYNILNIKNNALKSDDEYKLNFYEDSLIKNQEPANVQFLLNGKTANFIQNFGFFILLLHVSYILSILIVNMIKKLQQKDSFDQDQTPQNSGKKEQQQKEEEQQQKGKCQNFILFLTSSLFYTIFIEIFFRTIQELSLTTWLQYGNLGKANTWNTIGIFFSVISGLYIGATVIFLTYRTYKTYKPDSQEEKRKKKEQNKIIYQAITFGIKKHSIFTYNYNIFQTYRKILYTLLIVALSDKPVAICIIFCIFNLAFSVYTGILKPYERQSYNYFVAGQEGLQCIIALIYSILSSQYKNTGSVAGSTYSIIVFIFIHMSLFIGFTVYRVKAYRKERKAYKAQLLLEEEERKKKMIKKEKSRQIRKQKTVQGQEFTFKIEEEKVQQIEIEKAKFNLDPVRRQKRQQLSQLNQLNQTKTTAVTALRSPLRKNSYKSINSKNELLSDNQLSQHQRQTSVFTLEKESPYQKKNRIVVGDNFDQNYNYEKNVDNNIIQNQFTQITEDNVENLNDEQEFEMRSTTGQKNSFQNRNQKKFQLNNANDEQNQNKKLKTDFDQNMENNTKNLKKMVQQRISQKQSLNQQYQNQIEMTNNNNNQNQNLKNQQNNNYLQNQNGISNFENKNENKQDYNNDNENEISFNQSGNYSQLNFTEAKLQQHHKNSEQYEDYDFNQEIQQDDVQDISIDQYQ